MAPRRIYTNDMIDFLRLGSAVSLAAVTCEFNARFEMDKTNKQIHCICCNHGIKRTRVKLGRGNGKARIYTAKMIQFLCEHYAVMSITDLLPLFNEKFGLQRTHDQIKTILNNYGIKSGRTGYYEKGQMAWNHGVKGYMGANATSFKKGQVPPNRTRLWTERIDSKDGFILINIPETNPYTGFPTRYKHKHVWLWEYHNGPAPKGSVVSFMDGNRLNVVIDNLMLLSREELLQLNLHNYADQPAEVKPTILAMVRMNAKAGIRGIRAAGSGRRKKG